MNMKWITICFLTLSIEHEVLLDFRMSGGSFAAGDAFDDKAAIDAAVALTIGDADPTLDWNACIAPPATKTKLNQK